MTNSSPAQPAAAGGAFAPEKLNPEKLNRGGLMLADGTFFEGAG
jgi:hypothetical protein